MISDEHFLSVVSRTPLISVDLILRSRANKILLGRRNNRPAQGFWFVPGGAASSRTSGWPTRWFEW